MNLGVMKVIRIFRRVAKSDSFLTSLYNGRSDTSGLLSEVIGAKKKKNQNCWLTADEPHHANPEPESPQHTHTPSTPRGRLQGPSKLSSTDTVCSSWRIKNVWIFETQQKQ